MSLLFSIYLEMKYPIEQHYFLHTEPPRLNTAFDSHHLSLLVAELDFFISLENGFPCLIQSTYHYDHRFEDLQDGTLTRSGMGITTVVNAPIQAHLLSLSRGIIVFIFLLTELAVTCSFRLVYSAYLLLK